VDLSPEARRRLQGEKGDTGAPGPVGPQGEKGDTGAAGPVGPAGSARAVATVYGNAATGCRVHADRSRGVQSCVMTAVGRYRITLTADVSLAGTYPVCSIGNDSVNPVDRKTCASWISDIGVHVITVQVYTADESMSTDAIGVNVTEVAPVVVIVP